MFKNQSLGKKIGLSFFIVLSLLSVVLGVSVLALNKTVDGIDEYREMAGDTNLAGRLQSNMLMTRMSINSYLLTRSDKSLEEYKANIAEVKTLLGDAKKAIQEPKRAALIAKVEAAIVTYEETLGKVVGFDKKRNLVYDELVSDGGIMLDNLSKINQYLLSHDESTYYAADVERNVLLSRLRVYRYLQVNTSESFDLLVQTIDVTLKDAIASLDNHLYDATSRGLFTDVNNAYKRYAENIYVIRKAIDDRSAILGTLIAIGSDVTSDLEQVTLSIMHYQEALGVSLKSQTDDSIHTALILAIVAIVIGFAAAFLLTISITRPIRQAMFVANQLAEGDLTIEIGETSKDETGQLLAAIKNTVLKLRDMMSTISSASLELASASEELAVITEQSTEGIVKQETETDLVATAMNQMTSTVHDVADNAAKAAEAASRANNEATTGSQVLNKTIIAINSLSDSVNHSSEKLSEVEQEVVNISGILDVIQGIADQTNLLALNAAIEAARAGEQGRGFAVVADEVRCLASRTQESTQEIQSIIEKLQDGTQSTVSVMAQGKKQADKCVEQANEANMALKTIMSAISTINDMNFQIAGASEEQSQVSENINENVVNVKRIAEENAIGSSQTKNSSGEIAQLADQLKHLVTQFAV